MFPGLCTGRSQELLLIGNSLFDFVSNNANTAEIILANTVLHQIIICPPKSGGSISISTSMRIGSINVRI